MEEAGIIGADRGLQALVHHVANWMVAHIKRVAKNHVGKWARFNTNIFLDELLEEVGEQAELEAVTDALRVEQIRVVKVCDVAVVSLTSMEVAGHVVGAAGRLYCTKN